MMFISDNDDCVNLELERYNIDKICLKDLPVDLSQPPVSKRYNIDRICLKDLPVDLSQPPVSKIK